MPGSALSIGPRLRTLAVYQVVFQHVPVERCRQLIADVTGGRVGGVHPFMPGKGVRTPDLEPGAQLVQDLHPHDRGPKAPTTAPGSRERGSQASP